MVGTAFKQTCFPWTLHSFRSLLELLLTIASGLLEGDSALTCSYWKPWCLQLQVSGNLQITSSLIPLILHSPQQLLQCRAGSTVPETMCAQSYVSSYPVIPVIHITNPFSSQMEILKLFIPCHRAYDVI